MMKSRNLQTNAPKEPTISVTSALDTKNPNSTEQLYPGGAVNEHKRLEIANHFLAQKELGQQNENS